MSPYHEGREAAASGKSEADNPYSAGTHHHAEWLRGLHEAGGSGDDPFREGQLAASMGEDRNSNPYAAGSEGEAVKAQGWLAGYDDFVAAGETGEPPEE